MLICEVGFGWRARVKAYGFVFYLQIFDFYSSVGDYISFWDLLGIKRCRGKGAFGTDGAGDYDQAYASDSDLGILRTIYASDDGIADSDGDRD